MSGEVSGEARIPFIMNEFLKTEETYFNGLRAAASLYDFNEKIDDMNGLSVGDKSNLKEQHKLLVNLAQKHLALIGLVRIMQNAYQTSDQTAKNTAVKNMIDAIVSLTSIYERYCAVYDVGTQARKNLSTADEIENLNARVSTAMKKTGTLYRDVTILPIQRVPRYRLLFGELIKNMGENDSLDNAIIKIEKLASNMNESPRRQEKNEIKNILDRLFNSDAKNKPKPVEIKKIIDLVLKFEGNDKSVRGSIMSFFKLKDKELIKPTSKTLLKLLVGLEYQLNSDQSKQFFLENDFSRMFLEWQGKAGLQEFINNLVKNNDKAKKRVAKYRKLYKLAVNTQATELQGNPLYVGSTGEINNPIYESKDKQTQPVSKQSDMPGSQEGTSGWVIGVPLPKSQSPNTSAVTPASATIEQTRPSSVGPSRAQERARLLEQNTKNEVAQSLFNDELIKAIQDRRNKYDNKGPTSEHLSKRIGGEYGTGKEKFMAKISKEDRHFLKKYDRLKASKTQKSKYHKISNRIADFAIYLQQNQGKDSIMDYKAFCDVYQKILDKTNEIIAQHNSDKGENIRPTRRIIMKPEFFDKMLNDINSATAIVRQRSGSK